MITLLPARAAVTLALFAALAVPLHAADGAGETPTKAQAAAGWKSMISGDRAPLLRGYKQSGFPTKGWTVEGGVLKSLKGGGGGDLVSTEEFGDFELAFEFRCSEKANSGVMYRVGEKLDATWNTGPEYQVLEDATYGAKPTDVHSCGALYDLAAPAEGKVMKGAGEWNSGRILLRDGVVQHWLNGVKVVECAVAGEDWAARIKKSKFKDYAGFGVLPKGRVALQDHGDEVAFRNLMVRDLSAPMVREEKLFDGKTMKGWTFHLNDGGKMEDVWSVQDGVIVCKGSPAGYIRTEKDYTNYVLKLEWRFSPVTKKAGNSGVLLRLNGADKVWPRSVEAQLQSGSAGDFWNIENMKMTTDAARTKGRNTKHLKGAERPLGEWNEYEIVVDHGTVTLFVNGEMLNSATEVEETAGKIALQSEGTEIHFRNIRIAPLD